MNFIARIINDVIGKKQKAIHFILIENINESNYIDLINTTFLLSKITKKTELIIKYIISFDNQESSLATEITLKIKNFIDVEFNNSPKEISINELGETYFYDKQIAKTYIYKKFISDIYEPFHQVFYSVYKSKFITQKNNEINDEIINEKLIKDKNAIKNNEFNYKRNLYLDSDSEKLIGENK